MTDVLVLCYHAVSETWPTPLAVTPGQLERQLSILLERGYRPTTFTEAVTAAPAARTLAVTFDDAYRSVFEIAFPILSRLGVPGSVFAVTGWTGTREPMSWRGIEEWIGSPHEHELLPMSWADLLALAGAGWEVGSHTRRHPRLTELDEPALRDELRGSKQDCEENLAMPCRALAFPYGAVDHRVVKAARVAGYEAAGGLPARYQSAHILGWSRVGVYRVDDERRFRLKISSTVRTLRATPAGAAVLALARRILRGRAAR